MARSGFLRVVAKGNITFGMFGLRKEQGHTETFAKYAWGSFDCQVL